MHIELAVEAVHAPGIEKDQCDENVDRSLLGKPEAELEAANADLVELLDKKHAEAVGTNEPDDEADCDEPEVRSPVSQSIIAMYHNTPLLKPAPSGDVFSHKKSGFLRSRFSTNVSTWFLAP
jgi:hypothetical protein